MKVLYISSLNMSYISKYMKLICDLKKYTLKSLHFWLFKIIPLMAKKYGRQGVLKVMIKFNSYHVMTAPGGSITKLQFQFLLRGAQISSKL